MEIALIFQEQRGQRAPTSPASSHPGSAPTSAWLHKDFATLHPHDDEKTNKNEPETQGPQKGLKNPCQQSFLSQLLWGEGPGHGGGGRRTKELVEVKEPGREAVQRKFRAGKEKALLGSSVLNEALPHVVSH